MSQFLGANAVGHDSSRTGRWLRGRRVRTALWIAAVEAVLAALLHDVTRWTIVGLAVIAVAVYVLVRNIRSDTLRQLAWIAAASQLLAVVAVVLAFILSWLAFAVVAIAAVVALYLIFSDRS